MNNFDDIMSEIKCISREYGVDVFTNRHFVDAHNTYNERKSLFISLNILLISYLLICLCGAVKSHLPAHNHVISEFMLLALSANWIWAGVHWNIERKTGYWMLQNWRWKFVEAKRPRA